MHYLKLARSQIILAAFLVCSLLLAAFPAIDLTISRLFFHGGSFPRDQWWQSLLHDSLNWFISLSLGVPAALYAFNRLLGKKVAAMCGRKLLYLFLVLALGAGLIVNTGLKDNFGRARPRDVAEFGGAKQFTPAFVISHECRTNCSFSSGDAAGGFFSLALVFALARRRRGALVAAVAIGVIESLARISSGAHFFSDTVVSFFVMLLVADVLYFYIVMSPAERGVPAIVPVLEPALAVVAAEPGAVTAAEPRDSHSL
jgi:lipid A 4'-phosphatase